MVLFQGFFYSFLSLYKKYLNLDFLVLQFTLQNFIMIAEEQQLRKYKIVFLGEQNGKIALLELFKLK